mmetsp:Transcript_16774/g.50384  ORF Transcript_16774/g.50384 Transcript_16774/m.50384 type:complete len:362 (+) Transcript_16774:940-2025(+)
MQPGSSLLAADNVPHHSLGHKPRERLHAAQQVAKLVLQRGNLHDARPPLAHQRVQPLPDVGELEPAQLAHELAQLHQWEHDPVNEGRAGAEAQQPDDDEPEDAERAQLVREQVQGVLLHLHLLEELVALLPRGVGEGADGYHHDEQPAGVVAEADGVHPDVEASSFVHDVVPGHGRACKGRVAHLKAPGAVQPDGEEVWAGVDLGVDQRARCPRAEVPQDGPGSKPRNVVLRVDSHVEALFGLAQHRGLGEPLGRAHQEPILFRVPLRVVVDDYDGGGGQQQVVVELRRLQDVGQPDPGLHARQAHARQGDRGREDAVEAGVVAAVGDRPGQGHHRLHRLRVAVCLDYVDPAPDVPRWHRA